MKKMKQYLKGKNLPAPEYPNIRLKQNPPGKLTMRDIIGTGKKVEEQRMFNAVQGKE